ncbi:hypothetical protein [Leifsonia poae]|uniref:hypothetical protein n=1 Tax=Leifsonia poae TaxID=110933 RepID=UPI003D67DEF0
MSGWEVTRLVLLITHFVGLAAVIGPFIFQLRARTDLSFATMLVGSIVQVVSGGLLIGARRFEGLPVDDLKMAVKLAVALLVLAAVVIGMVRQRRRMGGARPFLLTAGWLAIANVGVAVVWT